MNHIRFSTFAHADHLFCSPLSSERAGQLVGLLEFPVDGRVLDVGCGKGRFLLDAVQRHGLSGTGVDPNGDFLAAARADAHARGVSGRVRWLEARVADLELEPSSVETALCIGSSHAFGSFAQAVAALADLVRPGGQVLVAAPYWRREPHPDYLALLGASASDHFSHSDNEAVGLGVGLVPMYSCVSSRDEWDHYEGLYCRAVERFVRDHPQDSDAPSFRERIRRWREGYRRWGRDTLGFGFYLFGRS